MAVLPINGCSKKNEKMSRRISSGSAHAAHAELIAGHVAFDGADEFEAALI
jgi:hypothetical protein